MFLRLATAACLSLASNFTAASQGEVPEQLQGKWVVRGAACDATGQPIVISEKSIVYADGRESDVFYEAEGNSIRIREEGTVYEYLEDDDLLIFRPEGFGMGRTSPMVRCPEHVRGASRRWEWPANRARQLVAPFVLLL